MDTIYFHTAYDLFLGVVYVVVLLVIAAGPALLDRYWMKLQEGRGKAKRDGLDLYSHFSWLSMFVVPLAGTLLFFLLALLIRDGLAFLELR